MKDACDTCSALAPYAPHSSHFGFGVWQYCAACNLVTCPRCAKRLAVSRRRIIPVLPGKDLRLCDQCGVPLDELAAHLASESMSS
jgi:hypothetical protein